MKYFMFRGQSTAPWTHFKNWYEIHQSWYPRNIRSKNRFGYVNWLKWLDENQIFYHIEYENENIDDLILSFYLVIENPNDEMLFKLTWM